MSLTSLFSFIRLVDYLVASILHKMKVTAVADILAIIQEQVCQTPSHAIIQSWSQQAEQTTDPAEEDMRKKVRYHISLFHGKNQ